MRRGIVIGIFAAAFLTASTLSQMTVTTTVTGVGKCDPPPSPNPMRHPSLYQATDIKLLWFPLDLRDKTAAIDAANLAAIRSDGTKWFTHIAIVVPPIDETPLAAYDSRVRDLITFLQDRGQYVVWGRNIWPMWPTNSPDPWAHNKADFYAGAIVRLQQEATMLGAVGTCLDAEPYGNPTNPQKVALKNLLLTVGDRLVIRTAIHEATARVGTADLIYPTSSNSPNHYSWAFADLGEIRLDAKSYYMTTTGRPIPAKAPPEVPYLPGLWGTYVQAAGGPLAGVGPMPDMITPAVAKSLDMTTARSRYPSLHGQWVYVGYEGASAILEGF